MPAKADRQTVPEFATDGARVESGLAEEAKWWDAHRDMVEDNLLRAIEDGTVQRGTARRLAIKARASRNITIRMAEADLDVARKQAEEKGLPYQSYIKSVLHEALVKQERRRAN